VGYRLEFPVTPATHQPLAGEEWLAADGAVAKGLPGALSVRHCLIIHEHFDNVKPSTMPSKNAAVRRMVRMTITFAFVS
jgi:hypothetical protein